MIFEEITLSHSGVTARVAPMRGSLITHLEIEGKPLLYLDHETFQDAGRSVRGGIPILFPFAGELDGNLLRSSRTRIGRHGFARERPWKVVGQNAVQIRTQLIVDDGTRRIFPHEFEVEQTCLIIPNGIQIDLLVMNTGSKPMPIAPGWHPYFHCPNEEKGRIASDLGTFDPAAIPPDGGFDFGMPAPTKGVCTFQVPGIGSLRLTLNPALRHLQFWSLPGADYACLEPWTGPNNAINTAARVLVPPGTAFLTWFRIELI